MGKDIYAYIAFAKNILDLVKQTMIETTPRATPSTSVMNFIREDTRELEGMGNTHIKAIEMSDIRDGRPEAQEGHQ